MRGNAGGATGAARGELGRMGASSGWYETAFRRETVLRRGVMDGAPDATPELGAHGADAGEGSARGMKNGRFAALREFGGSSEYREWIRGTATGDCVSMVECGRYIWHWDGWISYLCLRRGRGVLGGSWE